ncbi:hypothetical protein FO519_009657 [Halicephalobus sp. NKZ332]|nr:hypothetical protein FO519_009657 [Halicephalobus sp. NKZ332]
MFALLIAFALVNLTKLDCDFKNYELKNSQGFVPQFVDKVDQCSGSTQTARNSMYIKSTQRGNPRHEVNLCGFPKEIPICVKSHGDKIPIGSKYLRKEHSVAIANEMGYFLPPGLPLCNQHHGWVQDLVRAKQPVNEDENMNDLVYGNEEENSQGKDFKARIPSSFSRSEFENELLKALQPFADLLNINRLGTRGQYSDLQPDTKRKKIANGVKILHAISTVTAPGSEQEFRYQVCKKTTLTESNILPPRIHERMNELAQHYLEERNKDMRRRYLSFMTVVLSFGEIRQYLPNVTRRQYKEASQLAKKNPDPVTPQIRIRYSEEGLLYWAQYITSPSVVTKLPWGVKHGKLSDGGKLEFPNVVRDLQGAQLIRMYKTELEEKNRNDLLLSDSTLWRLLEKASATKAKSLQGVDSFIAFGRDAFDELKDRVEKWKESGYIPYDQAKTLEHHLLESQQYLETTFKSLLLQNSESASHCILNALSDPETEAFRAECNHTHVIVHPSDIKLNNVLDFLKECTEEIEEKVANDTIYSERTRQKIVDNLPEGVALVTADWAQKYEAAYHRERQDQYFGKRGIPWHITHVLTKIFGKIAQHTYVHLTPGQTQNATVVLALLKDVLKELKKWKIHTVILRSDNAGCYHSAEMFALVGKIGKETGVKIKEFVFSEPQAGKSSCDREAARIKHKFRQTLKTKDIATPEQMISAMKDREVLPFITMKNVRLIDNQQEETPKPRFRKNQLKVTNKKFTVPGIQSYGYWEIKEDGVRVSRFYEIGEGKDVLFTDEEVSSYVRKDIVVEGEIFNPLKENTDLSIESELQHIRSNQPSFFWRTSITKHELREIDEGEDEEGAPTEQEPQTMTDCFLHMYKDCLEEKDGLFDQDERVHSNGLTKQENF